MKYKTVKKTLINASDYNYSKEILELNNMYNYINKEKYLTNKNKYNFMSGDPIKYKPYPPIIKHLRKTLKQRNLHEYQSSNGNIQDRIIINRYLKNIGINTSANNITFTYSTTHAFNLIFNCLGKAGDAIIIPSPNYGLFDFVPERYGIKIIPLPLKSENNWLIDCEEFERLLKNYNKKNKKSKVRFFYNMNPHNPTGKVMSKKDIGIMEKIGNLAIKYDFYIIDDLIYRDLTYDISNMPISFASFNAYINNTIALFGISKSYNLASLRSGFIISNASVANILQNKIFQQMDSVSIINIQSLISAFNINNKKQYKKYFLNIKKKYLFNYEILKYLVSGINESTNSNYISKKKYINLIKKVLNYDDYKFALHASSKLSFLPGLDQIDSGFFSLLKIKSNKNYYDLFDSLFEEANVKIICGNSIMFPNSNEKVIRINFAVDSKTLILGIVSLKKYLDKN